MSPPKRLRGIPRPLPKATPVDANAGAHRAQWREAAACRGMDPDLFFPYRGTWGPGREAIVELCRSCPVREECLEDGLTLRFGGRLMQGIWGGFGLTEREVMIGERTRGRQFDKVGPRLRRELQQSPNVVSILARYRRGELSGQEGPETDSAA